MSTIFADSFDYEAIKKLHDAGIIDGVTTNPNLVSEYPFEEFEQRVKQICELDLMSVSVQATGSTYDEMMASATKIISMGTDENDNITVKVPCTKTGLKACYTLAKEGHQVNVTLVFSPLQAVMASNAGATYVSPFIGKSDENNSDGIQLVKDIIEIFNKDAEYDTEVIACSIRSLAQVTKLCKIGVDVITLPPALIWRMVQNPLTESHLTDFMMIDSEWKNGTSN